MLIERNRLRYDLDLRSLGVLSSDGNVLISPGSLISLEFRLKTPWGARSVASDKTIPQLRQEGGELIWQLVPGEVNHLEAVFWLPSPLGIGTLVIVFLVLLGTYLKYPRSFTADLSQLLRHPVQKQVQFRKRMRCTVHPTSNVYSSWV